MKYLLFLPLAAMLMWSCGNGSDKDTDINADTVMVDNDSAEVMNEVVYQIPSPEDFFSLLNNKTLKFKSGIVHDEKKQYDSRAGKELNMGVYLSDMTYLNTFGEMKTAVKYFARIRELADQLGLSTAIPEQTLKKLEDSSANTDSLRKISDESFFNVIQALEEAGNGKSLALIMTAGWIETIYLAQQLVDVKKFDYKDPLVQRICSQKITYNNVIKNLERFTDQPDVKNIYDQLTQLNTFFEGLSREEITVKQDTSKNVIGTPSIWKTDNEAFRKFNEQILKVRKAIVEQS
jgi:hypothetical protein